MHDIKSLRADANAFYAAMARRRTPAPYLLRDLESLRRAALTVQQQLQADKKTLSLEIAQQRKALVDTAALEQKAIFLRTELDRYAASAAEYDNELRNALSSFPNILDADVPEGADEADNLQLKTWGLQREFSFSPRQHFELGETLGLMDFPNAAKIAGSRFTVLAGTLARMERALGQFMLDLHVEKHDYEEASVPVLVNEAAMFGTGQLPKFTDDSFQTIDGRWLIPTAEVSLTNLVAGEILPEATLPIRRCALTDCFRSEAGSAGRDTRGMLRQHQFKKVELVSIAHPDQSDAEHERMTRCAEAVLEALNLPYRRMFLCAGDTGFSAARTYDLEVWLPGQNMWREISSCSNTRAFQARRMNARYRASSGGVAHVHTLNGSGVAVGRALIAVMENYQREDGSIVVPEELRKYMGGLGVICKS